MFRFVVLPCFVFVLPVLILSSYGLILAIDNIDTTDATSFSDYQTALAQDYSRAIILGYDSSCTFHGNVDPNFVTGYQNAVAAGFSDIHTSWLPCTGSANSCKNVSIQIVDLFTTIVTNNMTIGKIWLNLALDPTCINKVRIQVHEPLIQSINRAFV